MQRKVWASKLIIPDAEEGVAKQAAHVVGSRQFVQLWWKAIRPHVLSHKQVRNL